MGRVATYSAKFRAKLNLPIYRIHPELASREGASVVRHFELLPASRPVKLTITCTGWWVGFRSRANQELSALAAGLFAGTLS
jgi:hypothetical protein